MTKLETIPDEGDALLSKKPTGIRRGVAAAAVTAFFIGVSAAAALRTPAVVNWPSLWGPGTEKDGADPNRPHKHETIAVDDEGNENPAWWDDDDFPDDDEIWTQKCDKSCKSDKDCATWLPLMNDCGVCQDWGKNPPMECGGVPRPPIKHAQIKLRQTDLLRQDLQKCLTVKDTRKLIIDKCGGGDGGGHRLATQQFTYTIDKHGVGRILYEHGEDTGSIAVRIMIGCTKFGCDMILWDNEKSASEEKWTWDTTGDDPTWQIKLHDGEFCMQAGRKNGSPVVAEKCKDIAGAAHWDSSFAKQQWVIVPPPRRLP